MLTNGPQPAIVPVMRGKWKGSFIYGPDSGLAHAGQLSNFIFTLNDRDEGYFKGSGKIGLLSDQYAVIEGHVTEERLLFSVEDRSGNFTGIFKGNWNPVSLQFEGTWKTPLAENELVNATCGDWIMEFDEGMQNDGARILNFPVHYEPDHFKEICQWQNAGNVYNNEGRMFLACAIILLLPVSWLASVVTEKTAFSVIACLAALVAGIAISLFLFTREVLGFRLWKKQADKAITMMCSEPDFRVTIDHEKIALDLPSGDITSYWKDVRHCAIQDRFIFIETESCVHMFPRSSMHHHDFRELQDFLYAIGTRTDKGFAIISS